MVDSLARHVRVTIHRAALEAVFTECDRYDHDETGGRLIGEYRGGRRGRLSIIVSGIIEPGPNARRSPTSFFQDGGYQEGVFRRLEAQHPRIEHLGNWHTHHVNGYPTLSGGDSETYHRTVNHPNHNTNFFYALLVTARNRGGEGLDRYAARHFILYRGDPGEYEIPLSCVRIVDRPALWPLSPEEGESVSRGVQPASRLSEERAQDSQFFRELQPGLRPYLSKKAGTVYWRGRITLVDGTSAEIIVAEIAAGGEAGYMIRVTEDPVASTEAARAFTDRRFRSAREAVVLFERELNREIFRTAVGQEGRIRPARKGGV